MRASALSRIVAAMRVKSPFSQSAWFGLVTVLVFGLMMAAPRLRVTGKYNAAPDVSMPDSPDRLLERPVMPVMQLPIP
jgi:hypothetical protein